MSSLPSDLATFLGIPDFASKDFVLHGAPRPTALPGPVPYVPSPISPDYSAEYLKEQMHQKYAEQQKAINAQGSNAATLTTNPCPKGTRYDAGLWESLIAGCQDGYFLQSESAGGLGLISNTYCQCANEGTTEGKVKPKPDDISKYLPYLILGTIILIIRR
ncbi:MAG: hypothetical protein KGI33_12315 [Thaumarchaeota archaeon]|nr:hypothetical protein [Nitrososphaerota archaeon]